MGIPVRSAVSIIIALEKCVSWAFNQSTQWCRLKSSCDTCLSPRASANSCLHSRSSRSNSFTFSRSWGQSPSSSSQRQHPPTGCSTPLPPVSSFETSYLCLGASSLSSLIRSIYPGPTLPTLASPCSSLKNISTFNHITSLKLILPFNFNHFIISFFASE